MFRELWLSYVPCRDTEAWVRETRFIVEGCVGVLAQSFYVGSMPTCWDTVMENHPLPALQSEKEDKVDRVYPVSHLCSGEHFASHKFMNFSQGHSGAKIPYVNRACFPKEKTPKFT